MLLSEVFGPTFQGEGPTAGSRAMFVRLAGCNLTCSFCDSAYTWRFNEKLPHRDSKVYSKAEEVYEITPDDLVKQLKDESISANTLVITGGEPLLQEKELFDLIITLRVTRAFERFEIETAGTIFPTSLAGIPNVYFNVSPKLNNSGNSLIKRYHPEVLKKFYIIQKSIFKFVVTDPKDFEEIRAIKLDCTIPSDMIWIMAEGETAEKQLALMPAIAEKALEQGYNFTPRLHTLVWGNKRGV